MLRRSVVGLGALLGGFHLWLLGNQAWSGQLTEPDVILRWLIALALGAGLVAVKRRGGSLFGRQAVAMWVLAAVLHGPALGNDVDGFATPALPEVVATVAQAAARWALVGGGGVLPACGIAPVPPRRLPFCADAVVWGHLWCHFCQKAVVALVLFAPDAIEIIANPRGFRRASAPGARRLQQGGLPPGAIFTCLAEPAGKDDRRLRAPRGKLADGCTGTISA